MRYTAAILSLLFASVAMAGPIDAVVRLPGLGCSATVIYTDAQHSYLLGCAHGFDGHNTSAPLKVDFPVPQGWPVGTNQRAWKRLVYQDKKLDIALIEVQGPFPYVCPVAPPGYVPGRNIVSVGYDEMRLPVTTRRATLLGSSVPMGRGVASDPSITFTREPPWHGRSGGNLLDLDTGQLIGVCSAYAGPPRLAKQEDPRGGPGIYCSVRAIQGFLQRCGWNSGQQLQAQLYQPQTTPPNQPQINQWIYEHQQQQLPPSQEYGDGYYRYGDSGNIDLYRGNNFDLGNGGPGPAPTQPSPDPFQKYQQTQPRQRMIRVQPQRGYSNPPQQQCPT